MPETSAQPRVFGTPGNRIVTGVPHPSADLVTGLGQIPTAVIGDVMGRRAIMDGGITPLDRRMRIAGPAITVETRPGDNLMIHAALKIARPGDVLVIDGHGFRQAAVWGMLMTHSAIALKLGGLVIDGAIRDSQEIIDSGFNAFCRYVCAAGPHKDGPGQVNLPISCGGVAVQPGDIVVGDYDGIAVIPPQDAPGVIERGTKKIAAEQAREREIVDEGKHHQSWLIPTLRAKGVLGPEETL